MENMKEKEMEIMKNASLETVCNKIKKMESFNFYNPSDELSADKLQFTVLLESMMDKDFSLELQKVAFDIAFSMIDARFKAEYQQEKGV